jgi:hypothetical protein
MTRELGQDPQGGTGTAARIRELVMPSQVCFWRPEDFTGSPAAVPQAQRRLAVAGQPERVPRGPFRTRETRTALGMAPAPASLLTRQLAGSTAASPAGIVRLCSRPAGSVREAVTGG